ncbi:hypothetical protein BC833DRAFT_589052 [Globomyces pollinis-pini]|nr:hypothetical protein BC833DRAFT_589052 [Globomyces pollinis-pini]
MIFQIADFVTNDIIPFLKQSHQNVSKVDVKSFEFQLAGQNQAVYNEILEFNQSKLKLIFNQSHFHCDVCKNTKLGSESIQFQNCKHTYCISCVKEYFEYLIVQGNVELVCCPHEVCKQNAKENHISTGLHHLTFHDLQIVLTEEILTRYYELYHQKALQSRSGVVHCPRPMCQYPSIKSDNDSDTLIVCVTCNFPFCSNCLSLWHGTNSCQLENEEEPLDDICNAEKLRDCNCSKASKGYSQETHNRYHKRKQLDKKNIEESLRWIKEKSVQCPVSCSATNRQGCSLYIRRTVGCPSMYCHCGCHFCYNCGQTYESYSGPHNCRFLPHVTSRDELDTLDNNTMW